MEYIDLVDEHDAVIGTTDAASAHAIRAHHRVAAVYVFRKSGELCMQEHTGSGNRYDHAVGGHVRQGEDYDQAAEREAREELRLACPMKKLAVFLPAGARLNHHYGLFECIAPEQWKFQETEEVKKIVFMRVEEVVALMNTAPERFTHGFINTMREFIKNKKYSHLKINL